MKWSESIHTKEEDGVTTPTIKNHSVTYHDGLLYCFGGYDGRRNHQTLLLYSLKEKRWLVGPHAGGRDGGGLGGAGIGGGSHGIGGAAGIGGAGNLGGSNLAGLAGGRRPEFMVRGAPPPGRNGHTATLATKRRVGRRRGMLMEQRRETNLVAETAVDQTMESAEAGTDLQMQRVPQNNPRNLRQPHESNPNEIDQPMQPDFNMHVQSPYEDEEDAQIIIIGGWLGSGPLAASDTWILDLSSGLSNLRWFQPPPRGTPPGPCNMHSADYISNRGEVYVFRGGNGREYLNDLHALDCEEYVWRVVNTNGVAPQQRANHSSAVLEDGTKSELFIFGGWNGSERLNDIFVLDTETSTWSEPRVGGVKPHPRAGMTLTALRGRLYLFGGSGTSSKCFDDLQILDRETMAWLDVNDEKDSVFGHRGREVGNTNDGDWYLWDGTGGQDGMRENDGSKRDSSRMFVDSRSREDHHQHLFASSACASANPNDEDMVHSVFVNGSPPGKRAGHTATAVGRFIYVFGGSCGTDYLSDFFVLDTDPPPVVKITEPASPQLYARRLAQFYNVEEFADVIFVVEGRKVYGHKLVLSTVSDCFRAMFMTGFRESGSGCTEIEIPDTNYDIFLAMMEYIYTGRVPQINISESEMGMDRAIALLELADQFFLYNLKQICEKILQPAVNVETYLFLMGVAQRTNSAQLELYCRYFERNLNELMN